jgi:glycosyltransferase involved in cell wall biosynthesis
VRLLQAEYTQMAAYGGDVLVEHDITFDLFRQVEARRPSLAARWDRWRWERYERSVWPRYRRLVTMAEKDRALTGLPSAAVIPNGVDLLRFTPSPETPGFRLLFIGSFRHFPNVVAYRFLVNEIWPRASLRLPGLELTVVAGPEPELFCPEPPPDPRIRRLAFVADVKPLYDAANLVIIPTLVSAGTNLKALEAMAMRRAIVSTPSGVAGLDLEHGRSVWIGETAEELAEGVRALLDCRETRSGLAREARRLAEERFDWSALGEAQKELWRRLLA